MSARRPEPAPAHSGAHMAESEALVEAIAARVVEVVALPPARLVAAEAAGDQLDVPPSWVLAEARAGRIPHVRLGRYVRFDPVELGEWALSQRPGGRSRGSSARSLPGSSGAEPNRYGSPTSGGRRAA